VTPSMAGLGGLWEEEAIVDREQHSVLGKACGPICLGFSSTSFVSLWSSFAKEKVYEKSKSLLL
jgi:hypothetical protein